MSDNLLLADQRKAIKEIFGDLITNMDMRLPAYEKAEAAYEDSKAALRVEMKRLHEGLARLDDATSPESKEKIVVKMAQIAKQDISEKFAAFIETFGNLILEYGK